MRKHPLKRTLKEKGTWQAARAGQRTRQSAFLKSGPVKVTCWFPGTEVVPQGIKPSQHPAVAGCWSIRSASSAGLQGLRSRGSQQQDGPQRQALGLGGRSFLIPLPDRMCHIHSHLQFSFQGKHSTVSDWFSVEPCLEPST